MNTQGHTLRGDAVLLCVKPEDGWLYGVRAIAAASLLAEAALREVIAFEADRVLPGSEPGEGPLATLAEAIGKERKPRKVSKWFERARSWALEAVIEELANEAVARSTSLSMGGFVGTKSGLRS
jgi:hypothetical protein